MIYSRDWRTGEITGKMELFWIDMKELKTKFENYHMIFKIKSKQKVVSYKTYFEDRLFVPSDIVKDTIHVQLKK